MLSDQEMIQKIIAGETHMFSIFVDRYKDKVFNLVYRFTGDYSETEDICQEIFITVYKKLPSFKADARVSTWLYKIASNKCIDWYRSKKRKNFFTFFGGTGQIDDVKADTPAPQEIYILNEEQKTLQNAVNKLDEKYRIVVVMFYYQHLSYRDIAEILELSVRTVETRLYRAKKILKSYLVLDGYGGEWHEAGQH
ncbi:MAG: RNA polymerase sigma factor [Firmicutes bacterium]|nr:RNA polymerase sigma factor [Bacillota bacterium]